MENLGNLYVSFYKLNIHIICIVMKSYKVIWLLAIIAFYWLILPILCCIWESYLNNGYLLLIGIVSGYSKAIYSIVLYSTYIVYLLFFGSCLRVTSQFGLNWFKPVDSIWTVFCIRVKNQAETNRSWSLSMRRGNYLV